MATNEQTVREKKTSMIFIRNNLSLQNIPNHCNHFIKQTNKNKMVDDFSVGFRNPMVAHCLCVYCLLLFSSVEILLKYIWFIACGCAVRFLYIIYLCIYCFVLFFRVWFICLHVYEMCEPEPESEMNRDGKWSKYLYQLSMDDNRWWICEHPE